MDPGPKENDKVHKSTHCCWYRLSPSYFRDGKTDASLMVNMYDE